MSYNNKTTSNTKVSQQTKTTKSETYIAIAQCWTPSFARCHHDKEDNSLLEVSCRCKTCCSKSSGGNGLSFATVEYWLAGHELNAWKDPLGSGSYVVAIKSCTEKFLEKIHPDEYANGTRFWMNFEKNRFDVREPRKNSKEKTEDAHASSEDAHASSEPAVDATAESAPKRPTIPPAPAVNPWSKGVVANDETPEQEETARLMSAPLPKAKSPPMQKASQGKWKKVGTVLTPDSRHLVIKAETASSATQVHTSRIAPFDLRLETLCKHGNKCRNKAHTETSKFVCPFNHNTTATIIAKGEPIPDSHCSYDKITLVDGKVKIDKCKNKACPKDHLEHHVAYCKGTIGASATPAPKIAPQPVQIIYVLPNGQMMQGPPMMGPPTMPQFTPPQFHGKQGTRRPPPPNRFLPVPIKNEGTFEDAELAHITAKTIHDDTEDEGCGGKHCGNITPGFCTCDDGEVFETESGDEEDILDQMVSNATMQ